jgi:hypothetical protein
LDPDPDWIRIQQQAGSGSGRIPQNNWLFLTFPSTDFLAFKKFLFLLQPVPVPEF